MILIKGKEDRRREIYTLKERVENLELQKSSKIHSQSSKMIVSSR